MTRQLMAQYNQARSWQHIEDETRDLSRIKDWMEDGHKQYMERSSKQVEANSRCNAVSNMA